MLLYDLVPLRFKQCFLCYFKKSQNEMAALLWTIMMTHPSLLHANPKRRISSGFKIAAQLNIENNSKWLNIFTSSYAAFISSAFCKENH